ncbi:MAG: ANTAR domain-containing protein [Lachnospiraceae bacterium]|nr:ANTAR domain-containing protein [Lachnospiraceae bacterium]MBP5255069.1 ANTAR domain-containing protein [Lachnospiraceae bacterium]
MGFTERVYSVLVVSASEKLNSALSELLPESHFQTVRTVSSVSAARRAWDERSYDFVIINSPLPDDAGIRFAVDLGNTSGAAVLLLVRAELHEDIGGKVAENGVFTLPRPLSRPVLMLTLGFMAASRERLRRFEKKTLSFEEKMEEIRLVNRAKWVLINELKMDEPQAHRYIEKQAMDRCVSKKAVAEEIVKTYS